MKNFKKVINGFVLASLVSAMINLILLSIPQINSSSSGYYIVASSYITTEVCLLLGVATFIGGFLFIGSDKKTPHLIGLGLLTAGMCAMFGLSLYPDTSMLVALCTPTFSLYFVSMVLEVIYKIISTRNNVEDVSTLEKRLTLLKEWKAMLDDGYISQEEYDKRRIEILHIKK